MKRARAEADGDSDAEDPGAPPEAERTSQQEEEEDEAEYFRQAVGEEPDEGVWQTGLRAPGYHGPVCPCTLVALTLFLPTDMFPKAAKRRRPTGPPGKKQRLKERKPDRGSDRRPQKAKGKGPGAQAKVGPRGPGHGGTQGGCQEPWTRPTSATEESSLRPSLGGRWNAPDWGPRDTVLGSPPGPPGAALGFLS